jgi:hypothetical protein
VILDFTPPSLAAMTYRIVFDLESQDAGFASVVIPAVLPADGIHVAIPAGVPSGNYHATVFTDRLYCHAENNVTIHVIELPAITVQPEAQKDMCVDQTILTLSVEAVGENLTYQWYFNGTQIAGATDATYSTLYLMGMEGSYYCEVIGTCDTVVSDSVKVTTNTLLVFEKHADVLYVQNGGNLFVKYQWYKDGHPVTVDGQSQYYAEYPYLQGTYRVRVYLADGSWFESCDYEYDNSRNLPANLYPNPALPGAIVTVELYDVLTPTSVSTVELYDVLGRLLVTQQITGNRFTVQAPNTSGSYHLRIINDMAGMINKRFIVNQ